IVGIVDHQTGTRDLRELPPLLGPGWRRVEVVAIAATASMAGIPLFAGFVAKEAAYDALGHAGFGGAGVVLAVAVVGSMLTLAYGIRFVRGAFVMPRGRAVAPDVRPPSTGFLAPAAVLAAVGIVLGLAPALGD